jgi:ankyrin repeat protein
MVAMSDGESLEDQLVHSVWQQDQPAVARLLGEGADPNMPVRNGFSAIACAGENDETGEIVRLLVDAGADIDLQDQNGWTPLMIAVDAALDGSVQANSCINWLPVRVMASIGANALLADSQGRTVFDLAVPYGLEAQAGLKDAVSEGP